jgi:hypothetical protein
MHLDHLRHHATSSWHVTYAGIKSIVKCAQSCAAACDERSRGSWRGAGGFQQVPTVQGGNDPIRDDDDVADDVAPLQPKNTVSV